MGIYKHHSERHPAVQTDSKLSTDLYTRLGEDISALKTSIQSEMSRGISIGSTWLEIAESIAIGMNSPYKTALNSAIRIARTEGHRIQNQSKLDAAQTAADNGADVVKQWDATLDGRTRPEHRQADGQIRELDEYFDVGGEKMKAPGVGGSARNVCNCRCCMLQRARWALDEDELKTLQERAAYFGLDKTDSFTEFKEKYLNATAESGIIELTRNKGYTHRKIGSEGQQIIDTPTYNKITRDFLKSGGIIIRGEEAEQHLKEVNAYASYITGADAAFIRDDATISDVLEEMYHAMQDRTGIYADLNFNEMVIRREIDAQNYLLNSAKKYNIPLEEIEVTKANLAKYEAELETIEKGGK